MRVKLLFERLVELREDLPSERRHESLRRSLASSGKISHLCSRDELELFLLCGVEESHLLLSLVVSSNSERHDSHGSGELIRSLVKDLLAMERIVKSSLFLRVSDTSGISSNDEELNSSVDS